MKRKVVLSKRAKTKLENLFLFLETEWSLSVKNEFIKNLDHALQIIQNNPESFAKTAVLKGVHKCVVTRQNTLYYRFTESSIEIITIFDSRQDPDKLKKEIK
jgi:plasmid stabilization system protein ParE